MLTIVKKKYLHPVRGVKMGIPQFKNSESNLGFRKDFSINVSAHGVGYTDQFYCIYVISTTY